MPVLTNSFRYSSYVPSCFRKPATVTKHTGLNESDSAESQNEGASSDNPSDNNTGNTSKGIYPQATGFSSEIDTDNY